MLYNYWHNGTAINPRRITITVEQQQQIRFAIAKRCKNNDVNYQTLYTALYAQFNIPRYTELLATDFDEAISFIQTVELNVPTEPKPVELLDSDTTNQVMGYVYSLQREINRLGGEVPKFDFDEQTIAQGIITRMVNSKRMLLGFDTMGNPRISFIPTDHWIVTEENIVGIIQDNAGISRNKLPDIMNAVMARIGFS